MNLPTNHYAAAAVVLSLQEEAHRLHETAARGYRTRGRGTIGLRSADQRFAAIAAAQAREAYQAWRTR